MRSIQRIRDSVKSGEKKVIVSIQKAREAAHQTPVCLSRAGNGSKQDKARSEEHGCRVVESYNLIVDRNTDKFLVHLS